MPPKHHYLDEADKGNFLGYIDDGELLVPAAKRAKINVKTARDIKKRANKITVYCNQHNLLKPSLHDRVAIAPKSGRRPVLLELDLNQLDDAIDQDRHYREMAQFEVAQELDLHVSKSTVYTIAKEMDYNRGKPTKKLALTDYQECQRYEVALSRRD
jgi:hypothetical protein